MVVDIELLLSACPVPGARLTFYKCPAFSNELTFCWDWENKNGTRGRYCRVFGGPGNDAVEHLVGVAKHDMTHLCN